MEIKNIRLNIVDNDHSAVSQRLVKMCIRDSIGTWHSKVEQIPGETARQMGFGYSGSEADIGLSDYSIYEAVDFICLLYTS